ncbi:MAG TPA: TonB-dependent receptor [Candidatus Polarisedimenticolaceae bacterium]|nr:TonB-dependent receptor [Candidatus Polarisedimenticolaceae bacterium]
MPRLPWCALVLASTVGLAQEEILFLDVPSVVGASSYEQTASEAPASVTVITSETIARYGYLTLGDVVRSVRGFYTTYDRNYTYVGSRGFGRPGDYNARILLLLDGHPVNDNVFGGAYVSTECLLDASLIDHVEVIRGPSSSLYGTSAFFGVINVITKRGRDLAGVEAEARGGSFSSGQGRMTWGRRLNAGPELLVSAMGFHTRGRDLYFPEFDAPSTNDGWTRDLDTDRRANAFAKLAWGRFSVEAAYNSRTKEIPTASWGTTFGDPRERTEDWQSLLGLRYERTLADESRLQAWLAYQDYGYRGTYPYSDGLVTDYGKGTWWTADVQHVRSLGHGQKLLLGGSFRLNTRQDQGATQTNPYDPYFRDARTPTNWALFVQDELPLGKRWRINAGLRHDVYSSFGSTTNPRLAVIFQPDPRSALKLLYGQAFREANAYERYYTDGVVQKPNPGLEPETIRTYEIAYERPLPRRLLGTFVLYRYRVDDLIELNEDPADGLLVFQNSNRVRTRGAELEIATAAGGRVDVRGAYAYQAARDGASGQTLPCSPRHVAQFNLSSSWWRERLRASLEMQYLSRRRLLDGTSASGYAVTNLTLLSRPWLEGLQLSLSAYNLFDRRYADPAAEEHVQSTIQQDGRSYRLAARYAF